jgi:hypothetical protein
MTQRKLLGFIKGAVAALGVLALVQLASAQAVNGTIVGTVTDQTGAAVPNATVKATLTSTGATHDTVSNGSGNYSFPDMQPGLYTVSVDAKGFKKIRQENINLLSNTTVRVDASLPPGDVSETITVTTAPPLLQTDRADISTKLESAQVAEMPLTTGRNFQSLLNVVPGTAPAVFQHSQFFNPQASLQTESNGMPRMGNLYQIEGIDDDERTGLLEILIPPAEAIQAVDISTNNFEAELGRAIGAVTNVTLKSGTNKFHGSAFEFLQNNAVNARSYFGPKLGHLSYNYFGGSVGGPVIHDKLFVFGDYLRTTDSEAIGSTFEIPDARWYTDNGSGYVDLSAAISNGAGQIYDPATGDGSPQHPRAAFANNQLPVNRINPVSLAMLQGLNAAAAKYGTLNSAKPLSNPANNYATNLPFRKTANSFDTKVDFTPTEKNHLSVRYSFQRTDTFQAPAFGAFLGGPAGGGFEAAGTQTGYSTGGDFDHVFSPTFFTEVRVGVAHLRNSAQPNDYGSDDASTIGVPGVNISDQPFTSGQVGITVNGGFSSPLIGYSASLPWIRAESNIDMVNNWTKIVGNHSFKWGVDLRRVRDDLLQDQTFSPRGAFTFGASQSSTSGASTNIANDVASFLLDLPLQTGRDLNTFFPAYRQWWFFAYGGDKWQASPKMTIDYGLRWEFYPPATPRRSGGFSNYNPTNNTLVQAGIGGNPANLGMETQYRYFSPRTGISYRLSDSTVLRTGFGISYTPFPDNTYAYNYPVRANNSYQPVGGSYAPAVLSDDVTVASFQAGFPAPVPVTIPSNGIIQANTPQLISQVYTYIPLNYKNPYAMSWNVVLQQAFANDYSLQIAYVANHGVDIDAGQNINLPSTYGGGSTSDPEYATFGRTAATNQFFIGNSSNYESLQTQLSKRFTHGFSFTTVFTWGKELNYQSADDGGVTFFINNRRNYAAADYDRAKNFEQTFSWALPMGRGHALFNSHAGDMIAGGWQLSGVVSAVSGTPFTVTANGGTLNTPGTGQTATITGGMKVLHGIGPNSPWFDTTLATSTTTGKWTQPAGCPNGTTPCPNPGLGNTGRNQFRGPGYLQDNFSLSKRFRVWNETLLTARVDAFQLSNTPQFANPNGGAFTSSGFGTITGTVGSGQGSVNGVGGGRSLQGSVSVSF